LISQDFIRCFSERCDAASDVVIVTHMNPDGDAVGSEYALARFLIERGKTVRIVNDDPVPEYLGFIGFGDPKVEIYQPATHDPLLQNTGQVVLVDNSAPDRLGRMESTMRSVAEQTLCIDHHPMRDAPWKTNLVDVDYCATTAMIYDLTRACGWQPDLTSAWGIYVGLVTDTGFFRFNSTNARTHEIAAELLKLGVEPARAYEAIHERNPVAYVKLLGHALSELRLDADGAVVSAKITRETVRSLQAEDVDPTEITTPLLAMDGVKVAILFRELEDGRVKVSLRSKGSLDVHRLAIEFGGGGHRNASGIVMPGDLEQAVETVAGRAAKLLGPDSVRQSG
jgi:phosphoesterase RecJ-like protein